MLAELINAEHGLGYLLMTSQRRGLSEHIILILIIIGLLAYGIDRLLLLVPARAVPLSRGRGLTVTEPAGRAAPRAGNVVEFTNVTKRFGDLTVIKDVTFSRAGPAGQGRVHRDSRAVGLRQVDGAAAHRRAARRTIRRPKGTVLVGGKPVERPGADRGMVFQDYTSFDNRTVEDNVAFGLECRGVPAKERREQRARVDRQGRPRRQARRRQVSAASCRAACVSASRSRAR